MYKVVFCVAQNALIFTINRDGTTTGCTYSCNLQVYIRGLNFAVQGWCSGKKMTVGYFF